MRRTRFQQGSLQLVDRSGGKKTWEYRWYELQSDGSRRRRNLMVGSLEQYPNETAAQKAVAALRADINAENPRTSLTPISVQTLIEHYRVHFTRNRQLLIRNLSQGTQQNASERFSIAIRIGACPIRST